MKKLILLAATVLLNTAVYSQEKTPVKLPCDKKLSTITYSMNHPLHSWTGENKDVTSVILTDENRSVITQVAVLVKISSFDTKNANRDSHTMEVTEALKYPAISFSSTSIKQVGNKLAVTGTLGFHGVSNVISFEAEKNSVNNKVEIKGSFIIKMTQYKIDPPSMMGVAADDDIKIAFYMIY